MKPTRRPATGRRAAPGKVRHQSVQAYRPDIIEIYHVSAEMPLMEFLVAQMPQRKRTAIKQMLKHDQVRVGKRVVSQFNHPLQPGDEVEVNTSRAFVTFKNPRLHIVYEDDHLLVVNKGYGLLSVGTDKVKDGTAYSILRAYIKEQDPRQKLFIVHRLDQHTSGLMIFAKDIEVKETLQHNWNNMVRRRQYVCAVEGKLDPPEGEVECFLAENSQHTVYCTDNPDEGQYALTRYRSLRCANGYTLAEVELETGRKNQIRVHMQKLGHPVAGDRRYGARTSPIRRLALHARTIHFVHPVTRKLMVFETPIPEAFLRIVK